MLIWIMKITFYCVGIYFIWFKFCIKYKPYKVLVIRGCLLFGDGFFDKSTCFFICQQAKIDSSLQLCITWVDLWWQQILFQLVVTFQTYMYIFFLPFIVTSITVYMHHSGDQKFHYQMETLTQAISVLSIKGCLQLVLLRVEALSCFLTSQGEQTQ